MAVASAAAMVMANSAARRSVDGSVANSISQLLKHISR